MSTCCPNGGQDRWQPWPVGCNLRPIHTTHVHGPYVHGPWTWTRAVNTGRVEKSIARQCSRAVNTGRVEKKHCRAMLFSNTSIVCTENLCWRSAVDRPISRPIFLQFSVEHADFTYQTTDLLNFRLKFATIDIDVVSSNNFISNNAHVWSYTQRHIDVNMTSYWRHTAARVVNTDRGHG